MSNPRTTTQLKAHAQQSMRARLNKWTTDPPKPRKYPKAHPWRKYTQPKGGK